MSNSAAVSPSNPSPNPSPPKPAWQRWQTWLKFSLPVIFLALGPGGFGAKLVNWAQVPQSSSELLTQPAERKTVPITITANGTVSAERSINLSPKSAGVLKTLLVREGDRVRQGQVIAVMDDSNLRGQLTQMQGQLAQQEANLQRLIAGNRPEDIAKAQARMNSAQAELRQATEDLNSNQSLYQSGAISRQTYQKAVTAGDTAQAAVMEAQQSLNLSQAGSRSEEIAEARARVLAAQGSLESIQAQLNDTEVVAPFDGVVIKKYADVGAFVSPSMAGGGGASASSSSILTLASNRLQVVVNLSESQIAKVKLGQAVTIKADAFPGDVFTGKVDQIAPQAAVAQNVTSFEVRVAIAASGATPLKSGMNVEAQFAIGRLENTLFVPNAAVVRQEKGEGVYVLGRDRQPVFQPIQTGMTIGAQTAVKSGLDGNEPVLVIISPPSKPPSGSAGFGLPKASPAP